MFDRSELLKEFGFKEEVREVTTKTDYAKTGYPKPIKYFELVWEMPDMSLEEPYYWVADDLKQYFNLIDKLEDSFSAAENSAFFGVSQQRLGAQQDKVSQLLATTGKMIKELFQMVRELRIIDERLGYYRKVEAELPKEIPARNKAAEITLKGFFVDLVQGGGKSAASVYGMARELEFITLPDLFFDAPPFRNQNEVEKHVNSLEKDFNKNVLRVLIRHLVQYTEWRKRTALEHENRRRFMISYLKQHFDIIQMYIAWIKPYLRHVQQLSFRHRDTLDPNLITAFEGSMLDIELLARRRVPVEDTGMNGCLLITFNFRTRPDLKVVQDGYNRGPIHVGKMVMNRRVYFWTDEQVAAYKKLKEKENLLLMGDVSESVQQAMKGLGEELDKYLEEAKGEFGEKKAEEAKQESQVPQKSLTERLLGDFYTPRRKKGPVKKKVSKRSQYRLKYKLKKAEKEMSPYMFYNAFMGYKNFKKAHGMIQW